MSQNLRYENVQNPRWANQDHTILDVDVVFPDSETGQDLVPHTTSDAENEPVHTRELYAKAIAGEFGPIADFVPEENPSAEGDSNYLRGKRNDLLAECDYVALPDYWNSLTPEMQAAWAEYRQKLRDVPADNPDFYRTWDYDTQQLEERNITWPVKP